MTFLANLADRVLNRPLLITPEKAQVIMSVLGGRIGVNAPSADRFEGDPYERDEEGRIERDAWGFPVLAPYRVTEDGVGIISIVGSLVHRGAYVGASSGLVSYEGVKHQLKKAREDDRLKAAILDVTSPGGEAIGAFETAALVRELAAKKPVIAVVNGMAASAGYAIVSGATEIVTTPSAVSGSIGVVLLHADISKALSEEGVKPTLIFSGRHKVDGNPFEPLSDDVRAGLQAEVDSLYEQFLKTVAAGRGDRLTEEMARATEARTFFGTTENPDLDAVKHGLVDRVGTFESVLEELSRARGGRSTVQTRGTQMGNQTSAPAAENAGIPQADHDAAVANAAAEGRRAGASAERERLMAVLSAEGIAGNPARMNHALELAAEAPEMSAEKVVAMTTKHVGAAADASADLSLDARQSDQDPIGEAAGAQKAESGLSRTLGAQIARMAGAQ
ncbi:S49 family peptidase [Roseibium salinum]|uniref:S49 family peptidase n=1 Tax=Roseibium salinum TaxID=1604349 RepID=A0ABT3R0A8_9HYPH|nr:S49 family peptidase [Roseibium sp. DSM 29163]MCX2722605.1 S49 family peptidase [Roseibium sp. DSM 29163]